MTAAQSGGELRLDGQTAVVTGAGRGLGRAHALLLAARGANVVVNDLGGGLDGSDPASGPAEEVVTEIEAAGGTAIADGHSVSEPGGAEAIVAAARSAFGPVDIVVNNAGIIRPAGFRHLDLDGVRHELEVHTVGTLAVMRAAWEDLRESGAGRVVNTASTVGTFGLAGGVGYAAAKAGVIGITRTAALEGARSGIAVNAVAPLARTRMAGPFEDMMPLLDPELVSSVVLYLAHRDCPLNGEVISAGGGRVARVVIAITDGVYVPGLQPEDVAARLDTIMGDTTPIDMPDALAELDLLRTAVRATTGGDGSR